MSFSGLCPLFKTLRIEANLRPTYSFICFNSANLEIRREMWCRVYLENMATRNRSQCWKEDPVSAKFSNVLHMGVSCRQFSEPRNLSARCSNSRLTSLTRSRVHTLRRTRFDGNLFEHFETIITLFSLSIFINRLRPHPEDPSMYTRNHLHGGYMTILRCMNLLTTYLTNPVLRHYGIFCAIV